MLLAADIGNSYIKFAVLNESNDISARFKISTNSIRSDDEYYILIKQFLSDFDTSLIINESVVTSVVPSVTGTLISALEKLTHSRPFIVGPGTRTGFRIKIYDSAELGADIVSNAAGAISKYTCPCIITAMGTATTFTLINANGDITGTIIHPGLKVCARALTESAALLTDINFSSPKKLIGQNSEESIRSGLINGHICMIDGIIDKILKQNGLSEEECSLVATGGLSPYAIPFCDHKITVDPDLTLVGSSLLYRMNRK